MDDDVLTVDITFLPPPCVRAQVVESARLLRQTLSTKDTRSAFCFDADEGRTSDRASVSQMIVSEPHVSLFMMLVQRAMLPELVAALDKVLPELALTLSAQAVNHPGCRGWKWQMNPQQAPELFYHKDSDAWSQMQAVCMRAMLPFRHLDASQTEQLLPCGSTMADLLQHTRGDEHAQLLKLGYAEVDDGDVTRFNPHITFCWPTRDGPTDHEAYFGDIESLMPLPNVFDFEFSDGQLALFEMGAYGTCTKRIS
jgi:hypothetical protein